MYLLVLVVVCLGTALYLYKKQEASGNQDVYSGNGSGTGLYGKRDYNPQDKSYIATKWFMIMLIPIFPLSSYRVIKGESDNSILPNGRSLFSTTTKYQMVKVRLNWAQIVLTYVVTILILSLIIYLI